MNGNTFGTLFKITSWGESHGPALGCVIDGCPAGLRLVPEDFTAAMTARQGGQSSFTTARKESDLVQIESGVFEGITTGAPIALRIFNENTQSSDYAAFANTPRPGHADFTLASKHGHRDWRGGGRLSARETAARVAGGVVAGKILAAHFGVECLGFVARVGSVETATEFNFVGVDTKTILGEWWERVAKLSLANPLRVPATDKVLGSLLSEVEAAKAAGDSLGGAVECWVRGLPAGLGEPVFDKAQAVLGQALLSLPAAVGFEAGGGLASSNARGSEIRDTISGAGVVGNRHGGLLGGMTTGNPLRVRVHFHAPTSIPQPIESFNAKTQKSETITVGGRHDSFPLPRAVPMVEAMVKLALVDLLARGGMLPAKF